LFIENKNYGFERNLLGMRPTALTISILCFAGLLVGLILSVPGSISLHRLDLILGLVVVAALVLYWLLAPTKQTVWRTAEAYADRLAQAAWKMGTGGSVSRDDPESDLSGASE
jgi:hypothetical protein